MKRLMLVLSCFVALAATAQTADEVIQRYTAGMGGLDAFNKTTSAKMTGTVSLQGNDFPLTTQIINGKAMRTDVEVMDQQVTNVYNNGTGWKINPYAGATTATDVTGTELNDFKAQASLANNLMDYKNRGHQVELVGQEDVSGVKAFKIKLTTKEDARVTFFFITVSDYSLLKTETTRPFQGADATFVTFYTDIKEVGGLKFSMTRSQQVDGQEVQGLHFDKIELNVPVDEKIFVK
jgi:hypothetical protein